MKPELQESAWGLQSFQSFTNFPGVGDGATDDVDDVVDEGVDAT